jgi:hypothetical protein
VEDHEEGVALGVDLGTFPFGDGGAHQPEVFLLHGPICGPELLEQARGALDIGEQERDRSGRQGTHGQSRAQSYPPAKAARLWITSRSRSSNSAPVISPTPDYYERRALVEDLLSFI